MPGRLKSSLFGPYFRWTSVDGMINPFGLEVLANPDLLPFEKPSVAAHEWAHLAGYADESEASFVGFLTCIRAATPAAYSGWLFLYWEVNSEVGAGDRRQLASGLEEGPRRDVAAVAERVRRGQVPVVRDAGWRVYDEYLKANRVEEGVRNYGLVLTLLTRARFEEGLGSGLEVSYALTIRPAAARRKRSCTAAPRPSSANPCTRTHGHEPHRDRGAWRKAASRRPWALSCDPMMHMSALRSDASAASSSRSSSAAMMPTTRPLESCSRAALTSADRAASVLPSKSVSSARGE